MPIEHPRFTLLVSVSFGTLPYVRNSTAPAGADEYSFAMTPNNRTKAFAAVWSIGILLIAIVSNVSSLSGWLGVGLIALGPSVTLLYFSREPAQTTSQRIREARH